MSVVVSVVLNGVAVPVELGDEALAAIAAALPAPTGRDEWPAWMPVERAAEYLGCSCERLRKLAARRQIPFSQEAKGCRLEFCREELDEWMRSRRVEARSR